MTLKAERISFAYGPLTVLNQVDVELHPGVTAIIGPNAAGKSTLLKCLAGLLRPGGRIDIDGREMRSFTGQQWSERVSYLPQEFSPQAILTVFETVLLGRLHQLGWRVTPEDTRAVERMLEELTLGSLAGRHVSELSGGQAQMVAIAQALVREPAVLLLDEPTSNLDLRRQFDVCSLIRELTASRGISTAMALHDLNLAAKFADTIYVIDDGSVRCAGPPESVLTEEMIAAVYRVDARRSHDRQGRLLITVEGPSATNQQ